MQAVRNGSSIFEQICDLLVHYHIYTQINRMEYPILVEADFLVNLYERPTGREGIRQALHHIFKPEAGIKFCKTMFGPNISQENA